METRPTLLLMKGLPLSGKTEGAMKWVKSSHKRVRISWTDMLISMGNGLRRQCRPLAFEAAIHLMRECLKAGLSCVLDEENLDGTTFGLFVTHAKLLGANVEWHTMTTSVDECK